MDLSMIFFRRGKSTLAEAAKALQEDGLMAELHGDHVEVCYDKKAGPWLTVVLAEAPHVAEEARAIGEETQHADKLAACDARFEIQIEDLDGTLDEINTLIQTQMTLLRITGGVQFNAWNGNLSAD